MKERTGIRENREWDTLIESGMDYRKQRVGHTNREWDGLQKIESGTH